jgi:hypothetical protein
MERKNPDYLDYLRTLPCSVCGGLSEPHHIRDARVVPMKFRGGIGLKPYDFVSVPLCRKHHELVHAKNENINLHYILIETLIGYLWKIQTK